MKEAGILLHISSLPSPYGIGSLGREAYDFIDFLKSSGQSVWQILPVGPTSYGDSPYSALSNFAFNPYFIDLDTLVSMDLLKEEELPDKDERRTISYDRLFQTRMELLHKAYLRRNILKGKHFEHFIEEQKDWLEDYAMFMVLKHEHENKPWNEWYDDFKYRNPESLAWVQNEYKDKLLEQKFIQYLAFSQWQDVKHYANQQGIEIMGDMPIYCSYDSADVWANPTNFQLDETLKPVVVAGCPPDAFTADGQLWGNPIYDYDLMAKDGYSWWVKRVKHALSLFDILRIDHFRGFAGYYAIPANETTAKHGSWVKGPGYALFECIKKSCKHGKIVAENLGFLTEDVFELLESCGYPGMHIFQFELGDTKKNVPLKKGFEENSILYSGTHDNQTIVSFYHELTPAAKAIVDSLCKIKFTDCPNLKIIEFCMKQNSNLCMIPLQDYLGFTDSEGRMNTPSTLGGNWGFRAKKEDFTNAFASYLLKLTTKTKRIKE